MNRLAIPLSILALTSAGNTVEAFLADTLSGLVRTDMTVYGELRRDIFG